MGAAEKMIGRLKRAKTDFGVNRVLSDVMMAVLIEEISVAEGHRVLRAAKQAGRALYLQEDLKPRRTKVAFQKSEISIISNL